jgi:hypothetical protein
MVECDACGDGLGAVLSQQNQSIDYFNEALKGKATLLLTYNKEMLVVVRLFKNGDHIS